MFFFKQLCLIYQILSEAKILLVELCYARHFQIKFLNSKFLILKEK